MVDDLPEYDDEDDDELDASPRNASTHRAIERRTPEQIADLRERILSLHNKSISKRAIARQLGISERDVRYHLQRIEIAKTSKGLPNLHVRLWHSVEQTEEVIRAMWGILVDPHAHAQPKVNAGQVILSALDRKDRLQGTASPDSTNAAALAEAYHVLLGTLGKVAVHIGLPPDALQKVFVDELSHTVQPSYGVLLGAPEPDSAEDQDEYTENASDPDLGDDTDAYDDDDSTDNGRDDDPDPCRAADA